MNKNIERNKDITDFDELMIRIPIETAVLFLGQM